MLSIDLPVVTSDELNIIITDYLGREVYRKNTYANSGRIELNLSDLLSGVYNLSVIEGKSNIYTTKIVKR
jgi:hypothetical protein